MRLVDSPTERTTAATDLLLSAAALGGVLWLRSRPQPVPDDTAAWSWGFGLLAVSAALGAAYHGIAADPSRRTRLWTVLTFCLALALALVAAGVARDALGAAAADRLLPVLLTGGVAAFALSRVFRGLFIVFIIFQAAVLAAVIAVYGALALAQPGGGAAWVAAGAGLSLAAAAVQARRRCRVRLFWTFDHNGVFHVQQAVGMVSIWIGLGWR
jgi:hypothetical protein